MALLEKLEKKYKNKNENKEKKVYYIRLDVDKAEILEKIAEELGTKASKILQDLAEDLIVEYLQKNKK